MNNLQELSFPDEYFCDEVRDGFYVSETMKRFWAAQLVVLSEIDKICRKHGINWYTNCGTLIGVIRHKGYIPWDDDLDIVMLREEFECFLKYAREELPKGYCILSPEDNDEYEQPFARITNSHAIDTHEEFLQKYYGCPYVIGVDIFPMDKLYLDEEKEKDRVRRGELVFSTYKGVLSNRYSDDELTGLLKRIESENKTIIRRDMIQRDLLLLLCDICKECSDEDSKEVAILYSWISEGKGKHAITCYDGWTEMLFESTRLRVPAGYHEVLESYYGDYMKVVRGSADHEYPVYREQEEIFREKRGRYPTRYLLQKDNLRTDGREKSFMSQQTEMIKLIFGIHGQLKEIVARQGADAITPFLQMCQNAAVTIGNVLEGRFGSETEAVAALEQYRDKLQEVSCSWSSDSVEELNTYLQNAYDATEELFNTAPKEVLFLLGKVDWWDSISAYFFELNSDSSHNVNAIPIPYYYKDQKGTIGEAMTDTASFEKVEGLKERLTDFDAYNPEKKHPDIIVIQYPYDGYSGSILIPQLIYSEELRKYTDKLVYVPFLNPDPPESENDVAYQALREFLEQPAVANADKVVVANKELRDCYVKILTDITGEDTKEYWQQKICFRK